MNNYFFSYGIYSVKCLKCDFTKASAHNQDDDDAIMQTRLDLTTSHVICRVQSVDKFYYSPNIIALKSA